MAPSSADIKDWAISLKPGALFTLEQLAQACPNRSRSSVQATLGRLCKGEDPVLARPARGWYTRREQGAEYPLRIELQVEAALPWIVAGPGAGLASANAINSLGWTTQVPCRTVIAVVGTPPKPPNARVKYLRRSNQSRVMLSPLEIHLIEAVRAFDRFAEIGWDAALQTLYKRRLKDCSDKADPDKINYVASREHFKRDPFLRRCEELAGICAW